MWLKVLAPVLAAIAGFVTLRLLGPDILDQQTLREWLRPLGAFAPLVFILFLTVRPVTLLPGQVFTAVGGLIFGALWGTVYALIGSLLGALLVNLLSHRFGKRLMKRVVGQKYPALNQAARHHDFKFAFFTCINPLLPTDAMVAAASASGARPWPTALGVLLGTVPGTFLTAQFGSSIGQGKTLMTALSAAGLLVSIAGGAYYGRRVFKEISDPPPASSRPQRRLRPPVLTPCSSSNR